MFNTEPSCFKVTVTVPFDCAIPLRMPPSRSRDEGGTVPGVPISLADGRFNIYRGVVEMTVDRDLGPGRGPFCRDEANPVYWPGHVSGSPGVLHRTR